MNTNDKPPPPPPNGRDKYFLRILVVFGIIMLCFGTATMVLAIIGHPSDQVIVRLVSAMGAMFSGMLGLSIGYLTGRR